MSYVYGEMTKRQRVLTDAIQLSEIWRIRTELIMIVIFKGVEFYKR